MDFVLEELVDMVVVGVALLLVGEIADGVAVERWLVMVASVWLVVIGCCEFVFVGCIAEGDAKEISNTLEVAIVGQVV